MGVFSVDLGSVARGLVDMKPKREIFKRWSVRRNHGWWVVLLTPVYHKGRGPYVSIGLGWIAIYRGY